MADSGSRIQLGDVKQTVTCGICMQLFSDPRALSCGHTYCLTCLKGYQQSSSAKKACPECRQKTVPTKQDLEDLAFNNLARDLVGLVHTYEPETVEPPVEWKPKNDNTNSDDDDDESSSRLTMMLRLLGNLRSQSFDNDDDDGITRHRSVRCDECGTSSFSGARFKCGMCEDYDLCEECEAKPRDMIHDIEHIFIKLKKPRTSDVALERVLHEDSTMMGMTQDMSSTVHTGQVRFRCDKCKTSPITGTRYKCGICEDYDLCETCEETSQNFHDPEHIFLVLRHPVAYHTTVPQLTYNFYDDERLSVLPMMPRLVENRRSQSHVDRHQSVRCDECGASSFSGARFKCGMCEDYDLCEECEAKPRDTIHNIKHIFIKLKKPRTSGAASERVLHEESTLMASTQNRNINVHSGRVTVCCDKCKTSPITGTRYKCGICEDYDLCETCEKTSQNFHDPEHIFLVLRHPVAYRPSVPQLKYKFYR